MSQKKTTRPAIRLFALVLLVAMCAVALFAVCYQLDNKYTAKGPLGNSGVLLLSEQDLQAHPVIYLTSGWELYRDKLLTPEDFSTGLVLPDEYVFIGQYGGFEGSSTNSAARSPHGSATYRLTITLPTDVKSYTLELPEIYSAYRLYVNGEQMMQLGEPGAENYRAETGNSTVSLRCAGQLEIIVATADYSHLYSGMVYPPAFGVPAAVGKILNIRYGLHFGIMVLAMAIGLLYCGIWLLLKKNKDKTDILPLYYTALCFFYALHSCYPVVKTLATTGPYWYSIENLALPAVLLLVTSIQSRISGQPALPARLMAAAGIFVCAWAVAVPAVMGDSLTLMMAHSAVLTAYSWLVAFFLLITAAHGAYQGVVHSKIMLAGGVVFGTALVMDRLLPLFEPIRFGWFSEIAGGFFVLSIGAVMAYGVANQFRLSLQLENRVDSVTHMMEMQKTHYPALLKKEAELRAARHDFRHHMAVIRELAVTNNLPKLISYVESFDERVGLNPDASYCNHYLANMVLRMYAGFAARQDTVFEVEAALPKTLPIEDIDLCVMLSNLLENALEASLLIPAAKRKISVRIRCKMKHLGIAIDNTFDGCTQTANEHLLSRKQNGREGVGLASVRSVCKRYGGSATFCVRENNGFHSEVMLPMSQPHGTAQPPGDAP